MRYTGHNVLPSSSSKYVKVIKRLKAIVKDNYEYNTT